jgi:hypothetical protein
VKPALEVMLPRSMAAVPTFVSVKVTGSLLDPTAIEPKLWLVGVRVSAAVTAVPVPESEIVCGLFGTLSVMVTTPE